MENLETPFAAHKPFSGSSTQTSEPSLFGGGEVNCGNCKNLIFPAEEMRGCCVLRGGTPDWDGVEQVEILGFWDRRGGKFRADNGECRECWNLGHFNKIKFTSTLLKTFCCRTQQHQMFGVISGEKVLS